MLFLIDYISLLLLLLLLLSLLLSLLLGLLLSGQRYAGGRADSVMPGGGPTALCLPSLDYA